MNARAAALILVVIAAVAGCAGGSAVSPQPSPSPSPGPVLGLAELKLHLIDQLGPRWYCDPDEFPIGRGDPLSNMRDRWPAVLADASTLEAILAHEKLAADPSKLTDDQRLVVYALWKVLNATPLDPIGGGRYRFDYLAAPASGAPAGTRTGGTIDEHGAITVEQQAAAQEPNCPICLVRGSLIETPDGGRPVESLRIGDAVWTVDAGGRRIATSVIALGSMDAPPGHEVVHLVLADGRSVTASPRHPLGDGRPLASVRIGDVVDGATVVSATLLPYDSDRTFDIAVGGPTGVYFIDGIALGSTID